MASTRFPGKPLALVNGMPMIWHVWRAVSATRLIYPHYIATPDREIIETCERLKMAHVLTSSDCRSGTERANDAMRHLKALEGDIVVNIQADEPMIRPESLDELVRIFADPTVKVASLCCEPPRERFMRDRNRVKVIIGDDGKAASFQRGPVSPYLKCRQHVGVYAYRREVLAEIADLEPSGDLEQEAWMKAGYKIRMIEIPYRTVAVDVPADIEEIEKTA
jgi:3-deoxy-manno-octulosonate cytidylyltransferase (CMP-KDO synthetase)